MIEKMRIQTNNPNKWEQARIRKQWSQQAKILIRITQVLPSEFHVTSS